MTPEGILVKQLNTYCKKEGYLYLNIQSCNLNGFPDSIVFTGKGNTVYFELKREVGGRVSPIQSYRIEQLKVAGYSVHVVTTLDQIKEILDEQR